VKCAAVAAKIRPAKIISENHDDVWAISGYGELSAKKQPNE
jgi:hypothetical protein